MDPGKSGGIPPQLHFTALPEVKTGGDEVSHA